MNFDRGLKLTITPFRRKIRFMKIEQKNRDLSSSLSNLMPKFTGKFTELKEIIKLFQPNYFYIEK